MGKYSIKNWQRGDTLFGDGGIFEVVHIDHEKKKICVMNCTRNTLITTDFANVTTLRKVKKHGRR
jgi:hypothetical protein